jgi:hypothetical protein
VDGVRNDRRESAAGSFNIERAQFHKPVKRVLSGRGDIDAIWHLG